MKTAHTPGPWKLFRGADETAGRNGYVLMQRETRQHLMFVEECDGMGNQGDPNLKLVEAAPDLLTALIAAEKEMSYHSVTRHSRELPAIRAAIAKATGATA